MRSIILLLLCVSSFAFAQDLKLIKATKQTINSGAAPTSTTNYTVQVKKSKKCVLTIDSVVNVYTQRSGKFTVFKVGNSTVLSPNNQKQIDASSIKEKGVFNINFSSMKNRGSGRPGAPPMELMVPIADFTQGAIIYYRVGKKKKQLLVEAFEELETINAP